MSTIYSVVAMTLILLLTSLIVKSGVHNYQQKENSNLRERWPSCPICSSSSPSPESISCPPIPSCPIYESCPETKCPECPSPTCPPCPATTCPPPVPSTPCESREAVFLSKFTAAGPGLFTAKEWEEATFYILHNQNGPPARNCPMAFDAWLEGTDSAGNPVFVGVNITSPWPASRPFMFTGKYRAPAGTYLLYVNLKNNPAVPGSPFSVKVDPQMLDSMLLSVPAASPDSTAAVNKPELPLCEKDSLEKLYPGAWNGTWWQPQQCQYRRFTAQSACEMLKQKGVREFVLCGDSHSRLLLNAFVQFLTGTELGDEKIFHMMIEGASPEVREQCRGKKMYQNEALCHQYTKVDVMVCEDVHINLWHYWSIAADSIRAGPLAKLQQSATKPDFFLYAGGSHLNPATLTVNGEQVPYEDTAMVMQAMNESIQAIREVLAIPRLAIWRTIPEIVFEDVGPDTPCTATSRAWYRAQNRALRVAFPGKVLDIEGMTIANPHHRVDRGHYSQEYNIMVAQIVLNYIDAMIA